jgi:hypothetical protein
MLMKFDSQIIPHSGWEMSLMRIAFAALVWQSVPSFYYQTTLSHPNGLAHFLDLSFLMNPEILGMLRGLLAAAVVFYAAGLFLFLSLGVITFMLAACGSLENSQGAIHHSLQPVALAALAQWGVATYFVVRDHVVRKHAFFPAATSETHRLLVHAAKVALVSCYVASAFTKLDRSEGQWIQRTPNLAVAIAKTNTKSYLNVQEPPDHLAKAAPQFIIDHPNFTQIFFGLGFALELFSFLALLGRWPAVLVGVSLILMHEMIARVMDLHFAVFERLAFILLVNAPWLAALAIAKTWKLGSHWAREAPSQGRSERASIL